MLIRDFDLGGTYHRVQFDPEPHVYSLLGEDGAPKRRLTSVTACFSLPPWAIPWAAKAVVGEAESVYGLVLTDEQRRELKKAPIRIRDAAGDIGTSVHSMIHNYLIGNHQGTVDPRPEVMRRLKHWVEWYKASPYEYHASERMIYSAKPEYVGTCDHIFEDTKTGLLHVADTKSGSRIKPEGWLQTAAYQQAYQVEKNIDPKQFGKRIQLHTLVTKCTPYYSHNSQAKDYRAFRAALAYWTYQMESK